MGIPAAVKARYQFENNLNDATINAYNLTAVGSGPTYYTTPTPPQGAYSAGNWTDANYAIETTSLCTAMSGATYWIMDFWIVGNAAVPAVGVTCQLDMGASTMRFHNSGDATYRFYWIYNNGGANFYASGITDWTVPHWISLVNNGTSSFIYVDGVLGGTGPNLALGTITKVWLGRWANAGAPATPFKHDRISFARYASAGAMPSVVGPILDDQDVNLFDGSTFRRRR
jgi:hypothetical protein